MFRSVLIICEIEFLLKHLADPSTKPRSITRLDLPDEILAENSTGLPSYWVSMWNVGVATLLLVIGLMSFIRSRGAVDSNTPLSVMRKINFQFEPSWPKLPLVIWQLRLNEWASHHFFSLVTLRDLDETCATIASVGIFTQGTHGQGSTVLFRDDIEGLNLGTTYVCLQQTVESL